VFITDHILSVLEPFGTASDKELDRALIFLTSCLVVSTVHISDTEEAIGAGVEDVEAKKGSEHWVHGRHKYLRDMPQHMYLNKKEDSER
jgi:hypothetical protein